MIDWKAGTMEIAELLNQSKHFNMAQGKVHEAWKTTFWIPPPPEVRVVSIKKLFDYLDYETPKEFSY